MKTEALPFPSRISAGSLLVRSMMVEPSDTWQPACPPQCMLKPKRSTQKDSRRCKR